MSLIEPHGGRLIDREARGAERESLLRASAHMPELTLNARAEADMELIAQGALSPLEGFMGEGEVENRRRRRAAFARRAAVGRAASGRNLQIRQAARSRARLPDDRG